MLKGVSEKLIHKSELDAVKVNIKNVNELIADADTIRNNFERNGIELQGFLVQPYVKPKYELLIGGIRDSSFGPVVMFGSGGKYVEVYEDTCIKSAYLTDKDIDEMIEDTKIGTIIKGVRGDKPADIMKIKEIIKSSAQMMLDNTSILEFDFNPLIIAEDNSIHLVDIRIKVG